MNDTLSIKNNSGQDSESIHSRAVKSLGFKALNQGKTFSSSYLVTAAASLLFPKHRRCSLDLGELGVCQVPH